MKRLLGLLQAEMIHLVIEQIDTRDPMDNKVRYHYGCLLAGLDTSITRLSGQILFQVAQSYAGSSLVLV